MRPQQSYNKSGYIFAKAWILCVNWWTYILQRQHVLQPFTLHHIILFYVIIIGKLNSQQAKTHVDHLEFELVDHMHLIWDANSFLHRAQVLVKKTIDEHATYNTAELDRSHPVKKGAATRRRLIEQVAVNIHTMGTSFVGKVRDMQQISEAQIGEGVADMMKFKAQVSGHEVTEKASRIQACQHFSDWQLANRFERDRPVLLLPGPWFIRKFLVYLYFA